MQQIIVTAWSDYKAARVDESAQMARVTSRLPVLNRNTYVKLAVAGAVMLLGGCGQGVGSIVAQVGGGVITSAQVRHWTSVLASAGHRTGSESSQSEAPALDFLIKARVAEAEAGEAAIVAGGGEASWRLWYFEYARARGQSPAPFGWEAQLKRYLLSPAASRSDRLWLMRLSLLHDKLERRRLGQAETMVSGAQIQLYYRHHGSDFVVPEERDLAIVESGSLSDMRRAKQALMRGASPEAVAKHFSRSPVNPNGLWFRYVRGRGARTLDDAIFSAPPHVVVGPLRVYWYYVFEVLAVHPRHRAPLTAVSGVIRRRLAEDGLTGQLASRSEQRWLLRGTCPRGPLLVVCVRDLRAGAQGA